MPQGCNEFESVFFNGSLLRAAIFFIMHCSMYRLLLCYAISNVLLESISKQDCIVQ